MKGRIKAGEGSLIGNAGEYYVMAELLKQGIIAALAPRNAPAFDILATNIKENRAVRIRVKTKSEGYAIWQWTAKKDGSIFRDLSEHGDFTVLVHLAQRTENLKFYVVPSHQIDTWLQEDFKKWVETPGRNNRPHDPTNKKRTLSEKEYGQELAKYLNQWDRLWGHQPSR